MTEVLLELKELTKPGVSLKFLDEYAEKLILERGGTPYNKGYHPEWSPEPFPSTICCSIDHEICHGTPVRKLYDSNNTLAEPVNVELVLEEGMIVKYDLGVKYKTGCGDAALTVAVGEISNRKERAMRYGLRALYAGIDVVKAGVPISRIGAAIQRFSMLNGYTVIREFGGHHIGAEMHEEPLIAMVPYPEDDNVLLQEGAVICIEPMITPGKGQMRIGPDGWVAYVTDGQPVVMFEHQVLVLKDGYEILTKHLPGV